MYISYHRELKAKAFCKYHSFPALSGLASLVMDLSQPRLCFACTKLRRGGSLTLAHHRVDSLQHHFTNTT